MLMMMTVVMMRGEGGCHWWSGGLCTCTVHVVRTRMAPVTEVMAKAWATKRVNDAGQACHTAVSTAGLSIVSQDGLARIVKCWLFGRPLRLSLILNRAFCADGGEL